MLTMANTEFFSYLSTAPDVSFMHDEVGRQRLINQLATRSLPEFDADRESLTWKKGNIYFHALQDLKLAGFVQASPDDSRDTIGYAQSCYFKDLSKYLELIPTEESSMRPLFENLLVLGTSFDWKESPEGVNALKKQFASVDKEVIHPWVQSPDFELWRQDDHGNWYLMRTFRDRSEAEQEQSMFENRGHKQMYEVRRKA